MLHRSLIALSIALLAVSPALAVQAGDTYDSVIAEKGMPLGSMTVGQSQILKYKDVEVKLTGGKVASVRAVVAPPPPPSPTPAPTRAPSRAPIGEASAKNTLVWTESYEEAISVAKAQNRQVFMYFTGSDWCGWCKRLNAEVLSTAEFAKYAHERLVLLKVDFPRQFKQPAELVAQNLALARRYRIDGYPTVVVLSSEGRRLADLGYEPGGPAPFIGTLDGLR
ncbi:MAG TPA: thioredoxin family protein [Opitutaceae bacterium]|nr:thioredoxin family protein [Opitutaceae bacterium]